MNKRRIYKRYLYAIVLALYASAVPASLGGLHDFDGKPESLDNYLGKGEWIIVNFWASDCHICNKEVGQLISFHRDNRGKAKVLGIALDGVPGKREAQKFIDRHRVNFPNLLTSLDHVERFFREETGIGWIGTPTFMIYGPDGTLLAKQVGPVDQKTLEEFMAASGQ